MCHFTKCHRVCWNGLKVVYYKKVVNQGSMSEQLWNEINDASGEIFDIPELQEEQDKFDVEDYIKNGIIEYA